MEYLLFLQGLREAMPHWLNEGIVFVSEFSAGVGGLIVMALVYWCLNKRAGALMMMNFGLAYVCNGLVKNALRVDRPFNRDARLTPYKPATGYSFPSGHTMLATGFYGGLAVWQRKRKALAAFFVLMAVLTGFTRNWLGVHTIEDVAVGIVLSCGVVALNCFLLDRVEKTPGADRLLFAGAMVLCAVYCILLPGSLKPAAIYAGVMLGWFLERRLVKFEMGGSPVRRAVLCGAGVALVGICYQLVLPRLFAPLGSNWGGAATQFVSFLLVTAGWPAVMKGIEKAVPANRG